VAALLDRLRGVVARTPAFAPARLGPDWELAAPDRVTVTSGPLAGSTFGLRIGLEPRQADYYLTRDLAAPATLDPDSPDLIAHTHFERDPERDLETEWDIFIHPDYRGKGLTGLIIRLSYRHLLGLGGRRWFYMRKLMQVDSRRRELQNIGIGVIGIRLGMRPEPALEEMLAGKNVKAVALIDGAGTGPPGLFIELRRLPGVVVAAEFDDQGRPYADPDHYRRLVSPAEIARLARAGRAVVGNIDYCLPRENIGQFCRHFAATPTEHRDWVRALEAGARRNGA
jgi:GNAT superfamily N-acetyltransferase